MATVLLIEDDELLLKTTQSILTRSGHTVVGFPSVRDASHALTSNEASITTDQIEIVLLDLSTSDFLSPEALMDWIQLLFPSRTQRNQPKIGLVSGALNLEKIARNLGAEFFVEKPYLPADLRKKIDSVYSILPPT